MRSPVQGELAGAHDADCSASSRNPQCCEWRYPSDLAVIAAFRRGLRGFLTGSELSPDAREDLVLAASEAANNAVEHARQCTEPYFDACANIDGEHVSVVVQDYGRWRPPTVPTPRGRGLAMMKALVDTTVAVDTHGTTVTMRTPMDPG